jgi:hypothetical protein
VDRGGDFFQPPQSRRRRFSGAGRQTHRWQSNAVQGSVRHPGSPGRSQERRSVNYDADEQFYGMREFAFEDPEGWVITIAEK